MRIFGCDSTDVKLMTVKVSSTRVAQVRPVRVFLRRMFPTPRENAAEAEESRATSAEWVPMDSCRSSAIC